MRVKVCDDVEMMGANAAEYAAKVIRNAIASKNEATIIVATGASQFTVLANLVKSEDIDWQKVTGFHLDEYLGLPMTHPASFRKYLKERFVDLVPMKTFHYIDGERTPASDECARLAAEISAVDIDVALVGIGENGHLAFNDPPADFDTVEPYLVVELDEACRRQQLGEGWFPSLEAVPTKAISMSVQQILKSKQIVCSVPDARKARAVADSVQGPLTNQVPASILQQHEATTLYLDRAAAKQLDG